MVRSCPALGRVETIASLTTTTVVVTQLNVGSLSDQRFVDRWLLRAEAASQPADRVRRVSAFASATGTMTHAGVNYGDTTATNEFIEILEYETWRYDLAIQETLRRLRRVYRSIHPTITGIERYDLGDLTWVTQPSDIIKVAWREGRTLSNNRDFRDYSTVSTAGVLQPDYWTPAGASFTVARSTTQFRRPRANSLALTRSGTDGTLTQSIGLLENDVSADSLKSQPIMAAAWVWSAVPSQVRVFVSDGSTTTRSSFHTGGSGWEELTVAVTLGATASNLTFGLEVNTSNTVAYADECYLAYESTTLSDATRRDRYDETDLGYDERWFDQQYDTPVLYLPQRGRGGQYIVYSKRPFAQFDSTRVSGGTADADVLDAPLIPVATGAVARLYQGLWQQDEAPAQGKWWQMWQSWQREFSQLALALTYVKNDRGFGFDVPLQTYAPVSSKW